MIKCTLFITENANKCRQAEVKQKQILQGIALGNMLKFNSSWRMSPITGTELTKQSFFSIGQDCQVTSQVTVLCCFGMVCIPNVCLAIANDPLIKA